MPNGSRLGIRATPHVSAPFIEPMLCLAVDKLPEGPAWRYEVKLDGYRAVAVRTKTDVEFWSRNKRDFSRRFPKVARALDRGIIEIVGARASLRERP